MEYLLFQDSRDDECESDSDDSDIIPPVEKNNYCNIVILAMKTCQKI